MKFKSNTEDMIGNLPLIKTKAQYLEEKKDKTNKNEYPRLFKV